MKLTIEQLADKVNELISEKFKDQPESIKDGRQSSVLSTRRIRDYITKGLIEKPVGAGREKWFDNSHVDALVSLRLLQHNGLSDYYIKNSISATATNSDDWPFPRVEGKSLSNSFADSKANSNATIDNWPFPRTVKKDSNIETNDEVMQRNALDFLKTLQENNNSKKNSLLNLDEIAKVGGVVNKGFPSTVDSMAYAANPVDSDLLKSLSQTRYKQFNEYVVDEKLGAFLKIDSKADMGLQKKLVEVIKNEIIKHNKENNND
jgi:DNA-binding transcriptional MerR regulator